MKYKTKEKSFETIDKGSYSGHSARKNYTIRDNESWKDLWDTTYGIYIPRREASETDFSKDMIIAVYMGMQTTGGHSIEIQKILENKKSLEVIAKESHPKPCFMYTQALTRPYHIVKTKKTNKKVKFNIGDAETTLQ